MKGCGFRQVRAYAVSCGLCSDLRSIGLFALEMDGLAGSVNNCKNVM
jgi:hypothetical protein